jgi:hypothetical protein
VEREGALGVGVGAKLESLKRVCESLEEATKRVCESLEEATKGSNFHLLANHWRFIQIGMPNVYSC